MVIDFQKNGGLVPAIVQDATTGKVLMLGYMNEEALEQTRTGGLVTFYSRSKQRLWTKGETSGHTLHVVSIAADCDADTLLIKAHPQGPVCHTGADTCFGEDNRSDNFLQVLERIVQQRQLYPVEGSYTSSLFQKGINKIAQKVGEEAVELIIEAKDDDKALFLGEAADLLFHFLVLLAAKGYRLQEVEDILRLRNHK